MEANPLGNTSRLATSENVADADVIVTMTAAETDQFQCPIPISRRSEVGADFVRPLLASLELEQPL